MSFLNKRNIKYFLLIIIILGSVSGVLFFIKNNYINKKDISEVKIPDFLNKDWNESYYFDEKIKLDKESDDYSFLLDWYTKEFNKDNISFQYKIGMIRPVIDNIRVENGILIFDGWTKNPDDGNWYMNKFSLTGNFSLGEDDSIYIGHRKVFEIFDGGGSENDIDSNELQKKLLGFKESQITISFIYSYQGSIETLNKCRAMLNPICDEIALSGYKNNTYMNDNLFRITKNAPIHVLDLYLYDL